MSAMPAGPPHIGAHVACPLPIAEPRGLHRWCVDVPLGGNRPWWQSIGCGLPEGDMLIFVTELCGVGWLIHHRGGGLTVIRPGSVPLGREVVLIFHSTALQWIFCWWRVPIIRRMLAVVLAELPVQAAVAVTGWASPPWRTVTGRTPAVDVALACLAVSRLAGGCS